MAREHLNVFLTFLPFIFFYFVGAFRACTHICLRKNKEMKKRIFIEVVLVLTVISAYLSPAIRVIAQENQKIVLE